MIWCRDGGDGEVDDKVEVDGDDDGGDGGDDEGGGGS